MKRTLITALAVLPLAVYAHAGRFDIKGHVGPAKQPAMAYLNYRSSGKEILDSAAVSNGDFQFSGTLKSPVKATLVLSPAGTAFKKGRRENDLCVVYLENGTITISSKDSVKNAVVSGTKINMENQAYLTTVKPVEQKIETIRAEYNNASDEKKNDDAFYASVKARFDVASLEKENILNQYIRKNPNSFISLYALIEVAGQDIDVSKVDPILKLFPAAVLNSEAGKEFAEAIAIARPTAIGSTAPAFTQNDPYDKPVSLSDFKGKYVLLDFWASWCGPCRAENPNVVKAFQKYKTKGFTVLGVSLDRPDKKADWIAAIKADALEWTQVSDLKFWKNAVAQQYHINSIPQNFLIDPQGKIIGKNLRGDDLEKKLKELFGS